VIRIGLLYNLREDFPGKADDPIDAAADWDIPETIEYLLSGLEEAGFAVSDLGDPLLLLNSSVRADLDLVLSICEMAGYRHREALVPSLCELLKLPYMLSPPDVLVTTLDKNLTNLLLHQAGVPVAPWIVVGPGREPDAASKSLGLPLLVKPLAEGSGMGVQLTDSEAALWSAVAKIHADYGQPAIVQRYLGGREFTVGVLEGEEHALPLGVIEVAPVEDTGAFVYGYEEKEGRGRAVGFNQLAENSLAEALQGLSVSAFEALECRGGARIDLRLDDAGNASVLEVNPLPHLHPQIGDFCRSASAAGLQYTDLLRELVASSSRRWRL
jgi:D-alanine-D-alanine ligase